MVYPPMYPDRVPEPYWPGDKASGCQRGKLLSADDDESVNTVSAATFAGGNSPAEGAEAPSNQCTYAIYTSRSYTPTASKVVIRGVLMLICDRLRQKSDKLIDLVPEPFH